MIIAVDFDGTIVEHRYPAIGNVEAPFRGAPPAYSVERSRGQTAGRGRPFL